MALNRRRRNGVAKLYETAAAEVDLAATRSDVAALSSFGTTGVSTGSEPEPDGSVGALTEDLVYLGYSFLEVSGEYVGPGHMKPIDETTILVTQPFPGSPTTFQKDLMNLARKYRVDVVQVWDHEGRRTVCHGLNDPLDPDSSSDIPAFTVDQARKSAWMAYGSGHPESRFRDRHSVLIDVTEGVGDVAEGAPLMRYASRRNRIFGEFY